MSRSSTRKGLFRFRRLLDRIFRRRVLTAIIITLLFICIVQFYYLEKYLSQSTQPINLTYSNSKRLLIDHDLSIPQISDQSAILTDKRNTNKPIVTIGYCCDRDNDTICSPQQFVITLAEAIFKQYYSLVYQQCNKRGLTPDNRVFSGDDTTPDILLCQGYFYSHNLTEMRTSAPPIDISNEMRSIAIADNIAIDESKPIYRHIKGRPFLVTYNTEVWGGGNCIKYDLVLESLYGRINRGCASIHIPTAFFYEQRRILNNTQQLIRKRTNYGLDYWKWLSVIKRRFSLFLVRTCFPDWYSMDALIRVVFFELLNAVKPVTALGRCKKNQNEWDRLVNSGQWCPKDETKGTNCTGFGDTDGAMRLGLPFKFTIAFENYKHHGWSTEKIFNAFYSHSVPIYFGDERISEYLNENSFIHCRISDEAIHKVRQIEKIRESSIYDTLEAAVMNVTRDQLSICVDKVLKVDSNDTLYRSMLTAPVFKNNDWKNTIIDPFIIAAKIKTVLALHQSYLTFPPI